MADLGKARYSQVQPDTARYSAEKTHLVLYFRKAGALRISNMRGRPLENHLGITWRPLGDHLVSTWGALGEHTTLEDII